MCLLLLFYCCDTTPCIKSHTTLYIQHPVSSLPTIMESANNIPGIPNVLNIMFRQLVSQNTLHGWNIFEDRNGYVCLNIRFTMESIGTVGNNKAQSDILGTQYKRVSPKQQARNTQRVQAYTDSRITRSRSNIGNQIENLRNNETSSNQDESFGNLSMEQCRPSILSSSSPIFPSDSPRSIVDEFSSPKSAALLESAASKSLPLEQHELKESCVQACPDLLDQSSQTVPGVNRIIQCGVRSKHKSSQASLRLPKTSESSIQVQPDSNDYSVQTSVPTSDISEQVGAVFFNLVDSFSQVEIKHSDKSSEITSDLGTYNHTHSQTQFLCPGSENDPYSDNYWIGRHCNNVSCRYAGRSARPFSSRGPLYKCNLCNIVLCQNCKDESAHDDMCTQNFTFLKNGP